MRNDVRPAEHTGSDELAKAAWRLGVRRRIATPMAAVVLASTHHSDQSNEQITNSVPHYAQNLFCQRHDGVGVATPAADAGEGKEGEAETSGEPRRKDAAREGPTRQKRKKPEARNFPPVHHRFLGEGRIIHCGPGTLACEMYLCLSFLTQPYTHAQPTPSLQLHTLQPPEATLRLIPCPGRLQSHP